MRRVVVAGAVLAAAAALTGCSHDDVSDANAKFCDAAQKVRTQVSDFRELVDSDATRDQIEVQGESVRAATINAFLDAQDLAETIDQQLRDAGNQFVSSLEALDEETVTEGQARADVTASAQAFLSEVDTTAYEVGCSTSS